MSGSQTGHLLTMLFPVALNYEFCVIALNGKFGLPALLMNTLILSYRQL